MQVDRGGETHRWCSLNQKPVTVPNMGSLSPFSNVLDQHRPELSSYEQLYKHLHANPELSTQERETAELVIKHLRQLSSDLDIRTNIGGCGLAAILKNGSGKTVLLRADMDALPVREKTGLPYASTKTMKDTDGLEKPVMHGKFPTGHLT